MPFIRFQGASVAVQRFGLSSQSIPDCRNAHLFPMVVDNAALVACMRFKADPRDRPHTPEIPMNLKLPITVIDELADDEIRAAGELDLASGDIRIVRYEDYDVDTQGLPAQHKEYEFTVGILSNGGRDIEFGVRVDRMSGRYSVTPDELLEIKGRAAKLFSQPPGGAKTN